MKKYEKIFLVWFVLIIAWNFSVPDAAPIFDVLVAVILSLLAKIAENNV